MAVVVGVVRVRAQYAEPGAGNGAQRVVAAQLVLPVAEEGEVVVGEPVQQLAGLLDLLPRQVAGDRLAGQLVGDAGGGVPHLLPVLDGLADVGQDAQQVGGDLLEVGAVGLAVDLDVDPRLDRRVLRQLALGRGGQHLEQLAGDVAPHDELRVDDDVDAAALAGEVVGDGVDEEGHVVRDHLDDGVAARPAVLLDGGRVHPHVGGALGARLGQPVVRDGGAEHVDRVAVGEVLGGGVQVVALQERQHGLAVGGVRGAGRRGSLGGRPSARGGLPGGGLLAGGRPGSRCLADAWLGSGLLRGRRRGARARRAVRGVARRPGR